MKTRSYCAGEEFETPRRKIPIPLRSQTQPTSCYQTPITSPFVATPLSTKSEPITNPFIENIQTTQSNEMEVNFALDLVEVILARMKQLNLKIPTKLLHSLNDKKQHKMVIESILIAPIINHLIRLCIHAKTSHQKHQNYHQLLTFFIDYFQQIYPQLMWPKPQQIMQINGIKRISNKDALQTPHKNNISVKKEKETISVSANHRKSVEISNDKKFKRTKLTTNRISNDQKDETKFEAFIQKINEIGNKFDTLQISANDNKMEICDKIKQIQHKQQEFDEKLKNENTNKARHNNIIKEWEKSHHHLGKKQQENIDLLQHQTQQFESIAMRIKNALKQTEDPKIFESRFNFITKQTKDLEKKLDDVQQSVANKAKHIEESVKDALHKYKEMENVTDLISIGVSPHNLIELDKDRKRKENGNVDHECNTISQQENKLSFLNNISQSDTGFNYDQKRVEIKDIMNEVLDCKYRIDRYESNDTKSFKIKRNQFNTNKQRYDTMDIEDDDQFKDRIKKRIEKTMTTLQNCSTKYPRSLNVHWMKDKNEIRYMKEDSNGYKCSKEQKDKDVIIPSLHKDSMFECRIKKPSLGEIINNVKGNIESKKTEIKTLIEISNQIFKQTASSKSRNKVKIVRRTTKKPPELQFNSRPTPPPMPIMIKKKRKIHKNKKLKLKSKKQPRPKHIHKRIQSIPIHNTLISTSIQTTDIDAIQNSIEKDIQSMASSREQQDTVSILTHSQNNLNSFCDDILNDLFNKSENNMGQSSSKALQISQSVDTQNAERIECDPSTTLKLRNDIITSTINEIITRSISISENKVKLSVEEIINQQNIKQEKRSEHCYDNVEVPKELEQEMQTIIHISSTVPKQPEINVVEIKPPEIIHSPICKNYQPKLKEFQHNIKALESTHAFKSYPVSSTSTSTSTFTSHSASECASTVSSVPTSMISSFDVSETNRFWSNISITDSMLSGISISESDVVECSSDSDESEEFDNLKESLNRQWNEIQLALSNLNE